jgi:16S rRNA (guanine966-N2)-methyltransferase
VVAADVDVYLDRAAGPFGLVFIDPPYALPLASVERALGRLMRLLSAGGTVVLHRRAGEGLGLLPGLTVIDRRRYGDTEITRLVKEEAL